MSRARTQSKSKSKAAAEPRGKARSSSPFTPSSGTGPFLTGAKRNAALCLLLALITIALYSPVRGYWFVRWDDETYVTANPHIHAGLCWSTVKWAFASTATAAYWLPLTWLSHALDYQLFALSPAGHHWHSVLIHAFNAILLFLVLLWTTRRTGPSLLVAALFALHPLNVESVAWIAERKNVLSTFYFLAAIAAYVWYARKPDWRRYLLVALLFAAGLMAKPMVITLPFVLLLLDYWPIDRMQLERAPDVPSASDKAPRPGLWGLVLEKVPLFALSAASAWITMKAQGPAKQTLQAYSLNLRIENACVSYGLYLWKMIWPARLCAFYPHSPNALPVWQWTISALLLISVTIVVVAFRRKRYLPVGWFWFLGTLVPVIGLVQVGEQSMADRFAYIPLIGIFLMIAFGLADLADLNALSTAWRVAPALCVLAALSFVTSRQMSSWATEYALWSHALAVTDTDLSAHAHDSLGAIFLSPDGAITPHDLENFSTPQQRISEARLHYEAALSIERQMQQKHPGVDILETPTTLINLGYIDQLENRADDERQHYEEALAVATRQMARNPASYLPRNIAAGALRNLGNLSRRQNRTDEAQHYYAEAVEIDRQLAQRNPDKYRADLAEALSRLGLVEKVLNHLDQARQHDEEALQIDRQLVAQDPRYSSNAAGILVNLGNLDILQNRQDEARQHFRAALEIYQPLSEQNPASYQPTLLTVLNNLGNLDRLQNRTEEARQDLGAALELCRHLAQQSPGRYLPDLAATLSTLGFLDQQANHFDESRSHYAQALSIYRNLAQRVPGSYANEMAKLEASLTALAKKSPSQ